MLSLISMKNDVYILLTLHCCGSAYKCSEKQHFYFMAFSIYNFTQELFRVLYLLLIKDTCLSKL